MDKEITEHILERRRECMLAVSHKYGSINHRVYEYCERFSSGSEDIADAADFFEPKSA